MEVKFLLEWNDFFINLFFSNPLIFEPHKNIRFEFRIFFSNNLICIKISFGKDTIFNLLMMIVNMLYFIN